LSAEQLERALSLAGLSAPVQWHEVTGSTNEVAAALATQGAPEWTLVGAGHQTAGRGRHGRTWRDRPGDALMTSFVLRPRLAPESGGLLTLLAGAAWAEAASEVAGGRVRCKWPNDLMLNDAKVGGVLAESAIEAATIRWAVIGSGINLVPPADVPGAAGLGADVDPAVLLGRFLTRFAEGYRMPPAELPSVVISRWAAVSATLGRRVAVVTIDGARREGLASALDDRGRLLLRTDDGPIAVASDDIEHLR
jgi:BirA family biotin operon repressor/biotin-[acetyl-CoA-carboxylase] ligase